MSNIYLNVIGPTIIKHNNIVQNLENNNPTETNPLDKVSTTNTTLTLGEDTVMEDCPQSKNILYNSPKHTKNKSTQKHKSPKAKHYTHSSTLKTQN